MALLVLPGIIFWSIQIQHKLEFTKIKFDFPLVCLKSINFYEKLGKFLGFFFDLNRAIWLWKHHFLEKAGEWTWTSLTILSFGEDSSCYYETKLIENVVRLPNDAKFPKKKFYPIKSRTFRDSQMSFTCNNYITYKRFAQFWKFYLFVQSTIEEFDWFFRFSNFSAKISFSLPKTS